MNGMKQRLCSCVCGAGFVLVGLCVVSAPALAQNSSAQPAKPIRMAGGFDQVKALPPGGPAPRLPDGHVDLSGLWHSNSAGRMLQFAYPIDPKIIRQFDPEKTPEEKPVFKPGVNPNKGPVSYTAPVCGMSGTPTSTLQQISQHAAMELIHTTKRLVTLHEYPMTIRLIPTDGRPHAQDPDPTFNGDSTAHWEGDTLVVDAIAIDERMRNSGPFLSRLSNPTLPGGRPPEEQAQQNQAGGEGGGGGWFHSAQEHVVERFARTSKNYMTYQVTIEDPLVLAKPWKSAPRIWTLAQDPNDTFREVYCTRDEEPSEMKKIREFQTKAQGKK